MLRLRLIGVVGLIGLIGLIRLFVVILGSFRCGRLRLFALRLLSLRLFLRRRFCIEVLIVFVHGVQLLCLLAFDGFIIRSGCYQSVTFRKTN